MVCSANFSSPARIFLRPRIQSLLLVVPWGVNAGAPRYMEWFAAFGLMVTLVWLYLELLRLLSKLRSR